MIHLTSQLSIHEGKSNKLIVDGLRGCRQIEVWLITDFSFESPGISLKIESNSALTLTNCISSSWLISQGMRTPSISYSVRIQ